nr:GAF domain-containing sensor histidine kinase [Candidatus Cloacimonadota bacterium]
EMGNTKKLKKLLTKNIHINYKHIREEEFYHNVQSLIALAEHDYETALAELKLAIRHAGEINNNYAIAVFYVMEINCYYGMGELERAAELIDVAIPIIKENRYRYWQCSLELISLKLDLQKPEIPLRDILRRARNYQKAWAGDEYYQLQIKLMQIIIQVLLAMAQDTQAASEFAGYKKLIEASCEGISEDDRQNFYQLCQVNKKDLKAFEVVTVIPRNKEIRRSLNELIYNLANVNNPDKLLFLIQKGLTEMLAPRQYRIMVFEPKIMNFSCLQSYNADGDGYLSAELQPFIDRAFKNNTPVAAPGGTRHLIIIPLVRASQRLGYVLMYDDGELPFTRQELALMKAIKDHLAALIIRMQDYREITLRTAKMNQLMDITHNLMKCVQIAALESELVSACIDFTNSTRGFLIRLDEGGSNIYKVQLNREKQILPNVAGVSKTALALCQKNQSMISSLNATLDNRFKSAISVQDYSLHTVFCAPITVDNEIFGYVYLDNLGDHGREMYLNPELILLLMQQISTSLTNAGLYESLLKKNSELNAFEMLKDEFMAIVAHELNTPLTTLQGHVSRLKRNIYADAEEKTELVAKIEASVKKLILTTTDITTMNSYNLKESLPLAPVSISEILELITQEVQILSRKRKMIIKLEIEPDLPPLMANWEALHLMIYNPVLNAIRFTNDFGSIAIGARKSAFLPEKIKGKESMVIYVQDNGIGIPAYQLKNVFRKFFELNEIYAHKSGTIEYRSSGLGLGLATSQRIATLHGGKIWIKSKEKEGTTVFIAIPLKS